MRQLYSLFPLLLLSTVTLAADTIHHRLAVDIDPATHSLSAVDTVTLPASPVPEKVSFLLNAQLKPTSLSPGVTIQLDKENVAGSEVGIELEDYDRSTDVKLNAYVVTFPEKPMGEVTFAVKYSGVIDYAIKPLGGEYARGFSQTPGIITDQGVYLAGSTFWVPRFTDPWIRFDLTTTMTPPWTVVSQGTRTVNTLANGKQTVQWSSPEPMKEIYLIAAPFTEYRRPAGAVELMAFLRKPDETLANRYLETTAQYLELYRNLIGPYPFTKFALVENFWETGYGMPSFTLLGERIIRFPFILHSSYPHELLHNYWGNSVYVDVNTGNWCEGLTAYLADHLVAEQRGQGEEYRRTTLQKFSDYVTPANDIPLSQFVARTSPATEAIGYGKSLMLWNMLREKVGDERFVRSLQKFYRDNRFKIASYADIRSAFESVSGQDLKTFFAQWVERTGAPELQLSNVSATSDPGPYRVTFTLTQRQADDPFMLEVPIAISYENRIEVKTVTMTQKAQTFELACSAKPLLLQVDPQFQLFRKRPDSERPPALSKILGATAPLIVLPSKAAPARLASYRELAASWSADRSKPLSIVLDTDLKALPSDKSVWVLGSENGFASVVKQGLTSYDAELTQDAIRFGASSFPLRSNSAIAAVRHPANPAAVVVLVTVDNPEAVVGLARKLPHYGKYSYLVFEGNEPTNTAKGEWPIVDSPLRVALGSSPTTMATPLPPRPALAMLPPVFSSERMLNTIAYLASDELAGRGLGTPGLEKAADYLLERFKQAGLEPGADDGSYIQVWNEVVDAQGTTAPVKNLIGIIPGTNPALKDHSLVVSAHYDHLGRGWPGVSAENQGKLHPGADDNASGVAVMLELADRLGKTLKPQRTVVFVAFTAEEEGRKGSAHYVANSHRFPAAKAIADLNFDTVGRLGSNPLLIIGGTSAREWKSILMGASTVTGIKTEVVATELDSSDQNSFIAAGTPGVQFFAGTHPDYHKPTDVVSKIDAAGLVKVATLGREALLYLADRIEPLTVQGKPATASEEGRPPTGMERRVTTGSLPDFTFAGPGVKLAEVPADSPAATAGLQRGDIVVKIGPFTVSTLRDYADALTSFQPGMTVEIVYWRDEKKQVTQVVLRAR